MVQKTEKKKNIFPTSRNREGGYIEEDGHWKCLEHLEHLEHNQFCSRLRKCGALAWAVATALWAEVC
jgi:hypothetical protein